MFGNSALAIWALLTSCACGQKLLEHLYYYLLLWGGKH